MPNLIDYKVIKKLAKTQGVKVNDLLALAPANDPFYTGAAGELEAARWFADLWQRFGYTEGVHLRRVHYQVVSQNPPVTKPDGNLFDELGAVDVNINEYLLPEPNISGDPNDLLYSSNRDYHEQLQAYKKRQRGGNNDH